MSRVRHLGWSYWLAALIGCSSSTPGLDSSRTADAAADGPLRDAGGVVGDDAANLEDAADASASDGASSGRCEPPTEPAARIASYRAIHDAVYADNVSELDRMASSGDGEDYYTFQYVLDATLSMYEATGDHGYLARALAWAQTMMSKATHIDNAGFASWAGPSCDTVDFDGGTATDGGCPVPTTSYLLDDFQGATELARLARLVLLDPSSPPADRAIAIEVRRFVVRHIVGKWAHRKSISYLLSDADDYTSPLSDKSVLLGRILIELQRIAGALGALPAEPDYSPWITTIATSFANRIAPYDAANAQSCPATGSGPCSDSGGTVVCGARPASPPPVVSGALTWDVGVGWYNCRSMDTSHANRHPRFALDAARAGFVVQPAQLTGLANLLTKVLYNGDPEDPRIRNFIDGSQCTFESRGPDRTGAIYHGWIVLAERDDGVFDLGDALLTAIRAKKCNPTLTYNRTSFGQMELAAHLASAVYRRSCPPG